MKKTVIGILIVCLYCFPFVYFSMHQDFENSLMLGYLIMIIVTSLLAFLRQKYYLIGKSMRWLFRTRSTRSKSVP